MNIKDKLTEIEDRFAGTYKKELLDLWLYLHQHEPVDPILQVKLLSPYAKVPTRGSAGAIGWDLYALVAKETPTYIKYTQFFEAHERITVPTGIAVAIPPGYYGRIAPRSGLAVKQGIDVLAGVVDEDYRGEVKVVLLNTTNESILVDMDKPIAQLILERADGGRVMVVDELDQTGRGSGGFGSTDKEVMSNDK